jgi:putative toxin-antitoxin system antitoxin component (TIGR02293 family)
MVDRCTGTWWTVFACRERGLLQKGLPGQALRHLVGSAILSSPHRGCLESAVGFSLRTYRRRKNDARKPLSPAQSGRIWKFAEILGRAAAPLGSQAAERWLDGPAMALDQRKPIDLQSTPSGVQMVEDHLTCLERGVYI